MSNHPIFPSLQIPPSAIRRRGLLLVLSAPSGVGKTTIARRLLGLDDNLALSISVTTRKARPGEVKGRDYHFIEEAEFQNLLADDSLLEHASVFGNHYGTPEKPVKESLALGHDVLFDIEWQGHQQLKAKLPNDVVSVFILPPSMDELRRRLSNRGQDSMDVVEERMSKAAAEMSHYAEYSHVVVNRDIEGAVAQVQKILEAERLRTTRRVGVPAFVEALTRGYAE
ncbi:MAG: guanylate kinase [Alphaproteobacteria bacterium]